MARTYPSKNLLDTTTDSLSSFEQRDEQRIKTNADSYKESPMPSPTTQQHCREEFSVNKNQPRQARDDLIQKLTSAELRYHQDSIRRNRDIPRYPPPPPPGKFDNILNVTDDDTSTPNTSSEGQERKENSSDSDFAPKLQEPIVRREISTNRKQADASRGDKATNDETRKQRRNSKLPLTNIDIVYDERLHPRSAHYVRRQEYDGLEALESRYYEGSSNRNSVSEAGQYPPIDIVSASYSTKAFRQYREVSYNRRESGSRIPPARMRQHVDPDVDYLSRTGTAPVQRYEDTSRSRNRSIGAEQPQHFEIITDEHLKTSTTKPSRQKRDTQRSETTASSSEQRAMPPSDRKSEPSDERRRKRKDQPPTASRKTVDPSLDQITIAESEPQGAPAVKAYKPLNLSDFRPKIERPVYDLEKRMAEMDDRWAKLIPRVFCTVVILAIAGTSVVWITLAVEGMMNETKTDTKRWLKRIIPTFIPVATLCVLMACGVLKLISMREKRNEED